MILGNEATGKENDRRNSGMNKENGRRNRDVTAIKRSPKVEGLKFW